MKVKRAKKKEIRDAYLKRINKPDKYETFAHSYLIAKYVEAFVR